MIAILRDTAREIKEGAPYQWGHMGSCNCGNLAQTITNYSKADIHRAAMARHGDWAEQLRDYCPHSGLPLDEIIDQMLDTGFTRQDLAHLERLSDPAILQHIPLTTKALKHNVRDDVVLYLNTWADTMERELPEQMPLQELFIEAKPKTAAVIDA